MIGVFTYSVKLVQKVKGIREAMFILKIFLPHDLSMTFWRLHECLHHVCVLMKEMEGDA